MATKIKKGNAFLVRFLLGTHFFIVRWVMVYSLLSGYGPSVEPVYDDRSTAMIIMVIIICVLALLCMIFLYLWLVNRHSKKNNEICNKNITNDSQFTEIELQVVSEYRKLDEQGKELINNTIQTLNSKAHKD